jgi:hypothetical protein
MRALLGRGRLEAFLGVALLATRGGCWEWTGARTRGGFARIYRGGINQLAARYVYAERVATVPAGHVVVQTCGNRLCVRPRHLAAVTRAERTRRQASPAGDCARRVTCIRGHSLEPGDPNVHVRRDGSRHCRACAAQQARLSRGRKAVT